MFTEVNLECLSVPPIPNPEHSRASGSTDTTGREFWGPVQGLQGFARKGQ